jgi:dUTPase
MKIFKPLTIKIKVLDPVCMPRMDKDGDYIDVFTSDEVRLKHLETAKIPLGIIVMAPAGCYCEMVARSSTHDRHKIIMWNAEAVMDYSFRGEKNVWKFFALCLKEMRKTKYVTIPKGTKIAQFRIHLSQRATVWQKLRWLFSNGIQIEIVDSADKRSRGDSGHTGV